MLFPSTAIILASAGLIEARSLVHRHADIHIARRAASDSTATTLAANAVQSGSFVDGSQEVGAAEVGQALSATSQNNFINNCAGKTLTNGLQILTGSCNGIPMGDIPAKTSMVSSIITFPQAGSTNVQSDTTFNITVQMSNIVTGSFTNADATYYAAPQALSGGKVVGHTHVTVQDMGKTLNPTTPLDPTQFAFFKGINSPADANGVLTATVTGGLPAGNYRLCTMASASNHQPVLMPVAQRGTADDCTKFTVSGSGTTANAASNNGSGGQAAAAAAASAVAVGAGKPDPAGTASSAVSSASSTAKAGQGNSGSAAKGGQGSASPSAAKGGQGNASGSASASAKATSVTLSSAGSSASAASSSGNGKGKGSKDTSGSTEVTQITIIEYITFFNFGNSKGGVPPAVNKNGESFLVLGETFSDLPSAASAACGHQYTSCVSFAGPLFSVEECVTQKDTCSSAASAATSTPAAPATLTGSVTVAATQTLSIASQSGVSVLSTVTSSTTVSASQIAAAATTTAVAVSGSASSATGTVTAVAQAATSSAAKAKASSTGFNFSNSTATATSASSAATTSATSSSSSTALGGIQAPAVTNSGDSARPFLVNGNTFVNEAAALQRSCDIQFNQCANAVNGGTATGFTLADCSSQQTTCNAA